MPYNPALNTRRAVAGRRAIAAHGHTRRWSGPDAKDDATDTLTDVLHAIRQRFDAATAAACFASARNHAEAENVFDTALPEKD